MAGADLFKLLVSLMMLLLAAHLMARLFIMFRQPPVIGEILGGLLLGPTLFGLLAPDAQGWLFPKEGPAASGLGLVYQLGMLLLMFVAGVEMRTVFSRQDGRAVSVIAVVGMVIPFGCGLLFTRAIDVSSIIGPAGNSTALMLIIAAAVAVISIPVISRIMLDLGIMRTAFARIVLSVAVMEDIVLNVVIAIALGMVNNGQEERFGAASLLGIDSPTESAAYHVVASVAFFALVALIGAALRRRPAPAGGVMDRSLGRVAIRMSVILGVAGTCVYLGITPIFGAFVVGLMMGWGKESEDSEPVKAMRAFASGFFIPVYFAIVGLKLDLVGALDPGFALLFIAFACVVKASSVYAGARLVGKPKVGAVNLAVAMNARGGPGIVLATVAYDAGIVSDSMFTTLVLTAVITSLLSGSWLQAVTSRGLLPRDELPERTLSPAESAD